MKCIYNPSVVSRKGLELLGVDEFDSHYGCSPQTAVEVWEAMEEKKGIELETFLGALHYYQAFPTLVNLSKAWMKRRAST